MDKSFLVQITNELYRLTLLFPKKEPLRYKMREVADAVLANFLTDYNPPTTLPPSAGPSTGPLSTDLEVLDSYFEVAKSQDWVKSAEILNLQKEYSNLRERSKKTEINTDNLVEIQPRLGKEDKSSFSPFAAARVIEEPVLGVSLRQEKILGVLKEKGRAQVWEIKQIFPQVSKRTLRRDFENLFKNGIVERIGERNDTFYRLKA
jgi:hypothetical protein